MWSYCLPRLEGGLRPNQAAMPTGDAGASRRILACNGIDGRPPTTALCGAQAQASRLDTICAARQGHASSPKLALRSPRVVDIEIDVITLGHNAHHSSLAPTDCKLTCSTMSTAASAGAPMIVGIASSKIHSDDGNRGARISRPARVQSSTRVCGRFDAALR